MIIKLILFILLGVNDSHSSLEKPCIKTYIAIDRKWLSVNDRKLVKLKVKNVGGQEIKVPDWLYQGREDDAHSEVLLELMRKGPDGNYLKCEEKLVLYNYYLPGRSNYLLKNNSTREYEIALDMLHDLSVKGFYKVRVTLRLKELINCSQVHSKWEEFEIR